MIYGIILTLVTGIVTYNDTWDNINKLILNIFETFEVFNTHYVIR